MNSGRQALQFCLDPAEFILIVLKEIEILKIEELTFKQTKEIFHHRVIRGCKNFRVKAHRKGKHERKYQREKIFSTWGPSMEKQKERTVQLPKEAIRRLIKSEQFQNTGDIMTCIKDMFKQVLQEVLEVEMDDMFGYDKHERCEKSEDADNYRNGYNKKTVKSQLGPVKIKIPRDRNGAFEPKVLPKYHRNADGLEEKVLNLYAAGMTTRDISAQVRDLYGVEISAEFVSKVTDKLLPEMNEWQSRPLDAVYPFIFMNAIHCKIRDNHTIQTKAAYVVLGVNMEGRKDILGIWVGEHEGAKFWMGVLNDLKARGVQDIYLCCVDGLKGFVEAIEGVYPELCVNAKTA